MRSHEGTAHLPTTHRPLSPLTCEKPPRTIRLAGIPFFISCSIKAFTGGRGCDWVGGKLLEGPREGGQIEVLPNTCLAGGRGWREDEGGLGPYCSLLPS